MLSSSTIFVSVYASVASKWEWIQETICSNSNEAPTFCNPIPPSPTTPAPTPTDDQNKCDGGESEVVVNIMTDSYPFETSWGISDIATGEYVVTEAAGTMTEEYTLYTTELCLSLSKCYTFTIEDSYPDGFSTGGYYSLDVDGELYQEDFYYDFITHGFGDCGLVGEPISPEQPSTPAPSPTNNPDQCDGGESEVVVNIMTDLYPFETSWGIADAATGDFVYLANNSTMNETNTLYTTELCLSSSKCYTFVIGDSYQDGFLSDGYYSLKVDGELYQKNFTDVFLIHNFGGEGCNFSGATDHLGSTGLMSIAFTVVLSLVAMLW